MADRKAAWRHGVVALEYTPATIVANRIPEVAPTELPTLTRPALVRGLRLSAFALDDRWLDLKVDGLSLPLGTRRTHAMAFGGERISAVDYLKRVLERGDRIDCVAGPVRDGRIMLDLFWIHIVYIGQPGRAGAFSRKEDGLFAMRAKAGEKAERIVARTLHHACGHVFRTGALETPGHFEIRYDGNKRHRRPDLKCLNCGLTFEIKKRNRDCRFRVSHSDGRPFSDENGRDGWHAFVFPDMQPRFLPNSGIAHAIERGLFDPGEDQYDAWADIREDAVEVSEPPRCRHEPKAAA